MKKKFVSISLFLVLSLTLTSVVIAANDKLTVTAQPGEDLTVGTIKGQDRDGTLNFSTTKSGGHNYAKVAVMSQCDGKPLVHLNADLELQGKSSITKSIKMSSKCEYKMRIMNETGGEAKATLEN